MTVFPSPNLWEDELNWRLAQPGTSEAGGCVQVDSMRVRCLLFIYHAQPQVRGPGRGVQGDDDADERRAERQLVEGDPRAVPVDLQLGL